jgi:hypothetical protein
MRVLQVTHRLDSDIRNTITRTPVEQKQLERVHYGRADASVTWGLVTRDPTI